MSTREYPIFDAWWIRCPAASSAESVEIPDTLAPAVDEQRPSPPAASKPEDPSAEAPFRWGPAGFPSRRPRATRPAAPLLGTPTVHESIVHEVALPRLRAFARRLDAAGHETTVDARLGERPACVRLRLRPLLGPFDSPAGAGSVLEFVVDADTSDSVAARVWLDAFDTAPTESLRPPGGVVTEEWVDHVVVDFVGRALNSH